MFSHKRKRSRASSSNSDKLLSSSSSAAANIIASNDDILTQILVCLPPKSLLKFKTVSKHWLSLITDPRFTPKHSSRTISGLIVRCESTRFHAEYEFINLSPNPSRAPFRTLTFVEYPSGICILQSCNGLMLCRSFRPLGKQIYYIYNPTRNQYRVLPGMQGCNDPSWDSRITREVKLAFDPSKSTHYKVICICKCDLPDHYQVKIYSSKTGLWKPSGSPFAVPDEWQCYTDGFFWNGAIHWVIAQGPGDSLCFDVEKEKFRHFPMPTFLEDSRYRHFEESGGHLYLMEVIDDSDTLLYDVYEMERDYSGWFLKYKVDLHPIAAAFPDEMIWGTGNVHPYTILGIVEEETNDDSFLVLQIPNKKAIRYNFKDGSFRMVHDFGPLHTRFVDSLDYYDAHKFIESFACV
ncbi:hypothetical protein COLO4_37348 [Corchorus olitorius]|uniref:F-box domain-containing protein n=1 Tax=Corchorus olitorius TaxID=93759 RepID=A0A1R3G2B8_9ROSI|nr:hypothetical protein COLO4_37348 [Corchorus olitorius]